MTQEEVLTIFKTHNALLEGHFKLSSGLHSAKYLQCALVLQYPDIAEALAKTLASKFSNNKIDLVVGPALGGVTIAYEVGRALGKRALFTERVDGKMTLRRGFSINRGERALVIEDVITTGGSTKEVIDVVEKSEGSVAGVGSIIDRSSDEPGFKARFETLARIKVETFKEEDCPLCMRGLPITKPGSRRNNG